MIRERLRHGLADVPDPERDQQARQRRASGAFEGRDQVGRRFGTHPFESGHRFLVEREDVGQAPHELGVDELVDELLAETVDVEGTATREVAQVVLPLCPAVEVRASRDGLALEPHGRGRADGTLRRQRLPLDRSPSGEGFVASVEANAHDLRDHVARALDHDAVAYADVLAVDLVLVVERRVRDGDAADRHRLELRHGCERPGAADLDLDRAQDGGGLLGRET